MDIKRILLYIVVTVLGVSLFNAWVHDYPPAKTTPALATEAATTTTTTGNYTPETFNPQMAEKTKAVGSAAVTNPSVSSSKSLLRVTTDVFALDIDKRGGNVVDARLIKYPVSVQQKDQPVAILSSDPSSLYLLQSGLTDVDAKGQSTDILFTAKEQSYTLGKDQQSLVVELKGVTANGLAVTKTYTFERGNYAVRMAYQIENRGATPWNGSLFAQITRREPVTEKHTFYTQTYNGAAISSPETPYEKLPYKTLDKGSVSRNIEGGWIAMQQHYFLSAWIPEKRDQVYHYYSHVMDHPDGNQKIYVLGFVTPQMSVPPQGVTTVKATLYVGPEEAKTLRTLAPGLDHTIDYGWLWPVSVILFGIMSVVHAAVKNWGWAIIITTILIKMVFYWFSAKSFRSMAKMREMQPRIQALKERYGSDRQALSKATMELYRKEKINPLGGCLPLIIQIPVFIAFYYVIIESVELRQAPFIFWIHDLSVKDPYYVLPILMGASMLVQQWLTPTSPDPAQQKMMWILPVVFTVFFINFPAGLVLYWFVNNVVQILQQWYVTKTYEQHKEKQRLKRDRKK